MLVLHITREHQMSFQQQSHWTTVITFTSALISVGGTWRFILQHLLRNYQASCLCPPKRLKVKSLSRCLDVKSSIKYPMSCFVNSLLILPWLSWHKKLICLWSLKTPKDHKQQRMQRAEQIWVSDINNVVRAIGNQFFFLFCILWLSYTNTYV